ncbi:MAG: ABC transporter permease [Gaiellaceae bacterium]
MGRFIVARLFVSVLLFLALTLFVFVIFFVMPQPAVRQLGRGQVASEYDLRDSIALHGPLYKQYGQFVWGLVRHGSVGRSYFNRREVRTLIFQAAPVTLSIVVGGVIVWLLLAIPVGILSALRPRSLGDRLGMAFLLIGVSAHPVWLGLVLGRWLGYQWHIFPWTGYCEVFDPTTTCGGPTQWLYHLLLPWFVFALLYAAIYARMIRASVLETLDEDYVRTARAKGAGEWRVIRTHVLRMAFLPIVTMIGMDMGTALANVIFIESAFNLPGLGGMLRGAIPGRDLPVVLGVVTYSTIFILVLNLLVDLAYAFIDPRIRGAQTARRRGTFRGVPEVSPAAVPAPSR